MSDATLLEAWIKKHKLSNHQAGELLGGYHRSMVGRWRKGTTGVPKAVVVFLRVFRSMDEQGERTEALLKMFLDPRKWLSS